MIVGLATIEQPEKPPCLPDDDGECRVVGHVCSPIRPRRESKTVPTVQEGQSVPVPDQAPIAVTTEDPQTPRLLRTILGLRPHHHNTS
jgi:hypothetical protein